MDAFNGSNTFIGLFETPVIDTRSAEQVIADTIAADEARHGNQGI